MPVKRPGSIQWFVFCTLPLLSLGVAFNTTAIGATPDYERDIAPIFATHCQSCHGEKKQESGLRLDQPGRALAGGDHGKVLVPGDSEASLLVQVLTGSHPELRQMPSRGEPLDPDTIAVIRAWIDAGAPWPDASHAAAPSSRDSDPPHWAFIPPKRPTPPNVRNTAWPRSPIDQFILARLEKEGISPMPEADRATLLRRLHLDLIGLPPTPDELDLFLADTSPNAYATRVNQLLNSPHYGERWGRHWLDAARYADSDGFEKDKARFIWFYRDWVIDALNGDLPYDQFIIEQLAGDLLPNATQDQQVATGFLRNSMLNEEGGIDPEQFRMDGLFDRVEAIGKAILGITIQCAQCHDHKFDPISQAEYYQLFAYINNDREGSQVVHTPAQRRLITSLRSKISAVDRDFAAAIPDASERQAEWERQTLPSLPTWHTLSAHNAGDNSQRYLYLDDGSILAGGYAPTKWTAPFRATNTLSRITAFRIEQLPHPDLPSGGPGRSLKGMAALSEFKVEMRDPANSKEPRWVNFTRALADFSNEEKPLEAEFNDRSDQKRVYGPVAYAIDGNADTAWGIDAGPGRRNVARQAIFIPETPIEAAEGAVLTFHLQQNHGGWNSDDNQNHNLGRFRLSVTADNAIPESTLPLTAELALRIPAQDRNPEEAHAVFDAWRAAETGFAKWTTSIEALRRQWPEGFTTLTLKSDGTTRTTHLLRRGDWLKPADPVQPGTPAALHPLPPNADSSRLTFARWLVDRRSPTTARVLVNRVWQTYFGTGLLETPEDFGTQAPPPSHPDLLDWLAVEFMDNGWSLKDLHRQIVSSATYQQSSHITPERLEQDPLNRLLARGARFRVEGEIVRDIALAVSGLLQRQIGGPPIFSPADPQLFQPPNSYGPFEWNSVTGPERYRRALYTFRRRSTPYPLLAAFDSPTGDFSCVRRTRSNTPIQALTSLNEVVFMEAAQALGRRIVAHGGTSDPDRIRFGFLRVLGREPEPAEIADLLKLLDTASSHIGEGWVSALELGAGPGTTKLEIDPAHPLPPTVTPTQLASYTVLARVLLNLDETFTRE